MNFLKIFLFLFALFILAGCGTVNNSTNPNVSGTITIYSVFNGAIPESVNSTRFSWSPTSNLIAFETSEFNVYRVTADENSTPVTVTAYETISSSNDGGEAVSYIADGSLCYYVGWIYGSPDDRDMHVMNALPHQVYNSPTPSILHRFNGDNVGISHNAAESPEVLSMTSNEEKGVIVWGWQSSGSTRAYLLDWSNGAVTSNRIDNNQKYMEIDISKDGNYFAFVTTANVVGYLNAGEVTENIIGSGSNISWTNDNKIGYVDYDGGYTLYDLNTKTSTNYSVNSGTVLQCAVVNWDGTKIAFRTFGESDTGISVGVLNN